MCRVSPYVGMAAIRTVPCSSEIVVRLDQDGGAQRAGVRDALVDVGHLEREVDDAVAVAAVVVEQRAVGETPPVNTKRAEPERST